VEVVTLGACQSEQAPYLELAQSGTELTGQICDSYLQNCAPLENGSATAVQLTFGFDPDGVGRSATLAITDDTLVGTIHGNKCVCEWPITFYRLR
jgi:hypothetical protein